MIRGFTLIEILIVLGILFVLSVIALPSFSTFQGTQLVTTTGEEIISFLTKARTDTLSSKGDTLYGIFFDESHITFFEGEYDSESETNRDFFFSERVEISEINLSDESTTVSFERLTGKADYYGNVVITLKSDPSVIKTIYIEPTGAVSIQ